MNKGDVVSKRRKNEEAQPPRKRVTDSHSDSEKPASVKQRKVKVAPDAVDDWDIQAVRFLFTLLLVHYYGSLHLTFQDGLVKSVTRLDGTDESFHFEVLARPGKKGIISLIDSFICLTPS